MSTEAENTAAEETQEQTPEQEQISPLDMDDESFAKLGDSYLQEGFLLDKEDPTADDAEDLEQEEETEDENSNSENSDEGPEGQNTGTDNDDLDEDQDTDSEKDPLEEEESTESKDKEPDTDVSEEAQAKEFYKKLTAPFKANGQDYTVESAEEAISLMQRGLGFAKKMSQLKPHLRMLKTLDKHNLLSEDKVSFLVDVLEKKNPQAIGKLLSDAGVDPMDLDLEASKDYKQPDHMVSEQEMLINETVDSLRSSPNFSKLIDLASDNWDRSSREFITANPQVLNYLDTQMESGIFDAITSEMTKQRALGKLVGVSDIEAYRKVGDELAQAGRFDHLGKAPAKEAAAPKGQQDTEQKPFRRSAPSKQDKDLNDKRKAASPSKGTSGKAVDKPASMKSPLEMDDEEFQREFGSIRL